MKGKDNIDRLVDRLNRCHNPRLVLDSLATLLEPRLQDIDNTFKEEEIAVGKILPFAYESKRH